METKVFVFSTEAFHCSKFYQNEAKYEKDSFKGGLSMKFVIKNA